MAQAKVTNFFKTRKGSNNIHASKRRKLQNVQEDNIISQVLAEDKTAIPEPTIQAQSKNEISGNLNVQTVNKRGESESTKQTEAKNVSKTMTRSRAKSTRTTRSTRSNAKKTEDIRKLLQKNTEEEDNELDVTSINDSLPTAACDDHEGSSPVTPSKRPTREENAVKEKRSRKTVRKDLLKENDNEFRTPQKGFDFSKFLDESSKESSARRKLVLKRRVSGDGHTPVLQLNTEEVTETTTDKTSDHAEVKETSKTQKGKAKTKSREQKATKKEEESKQLKETVIQEENKTKEPAASQKGPKLKETGKENTTQLEESTSKSKTVDLDIKKLDPKAVKLKLAKSGKLAELQERLSKFSEAAAKVQESKEARARAAESESTSNKAPAYERFHALAQPVPPTLTLPYQYKLLAEMFSSVDTVLSMLYKRSETCTFTRLKTSVQNLMKRNFEEKNLGQIKTVYPTALKFRQERNLPGFGKKETGYQLTIEPDLTDVTGENENAVLTNDGRVAMTAAKMIQRKKIFHHSLIDIVKGHHKNFLSTLDRPLSVDDDKITRWHPKFLVDQVPIVEVAELPQPPEVNRIFTAKAALEEARNRLTPRTVKALEKVSVNSKESNSKPTSTESPNSTPKKAPVPSTPSSSVKGVSQSLLERIRAKEAAKQEAMMMRSPEQDRKMAMLGRLPEVARILRTFFVTMKKPAIFLEDAVGKVSDSYRSSMGRSEAEAHVKMVVEMLPEWAQTVTIKRGTFLKLDKNKDMTEITNKLTMKLKEASR